MKSLGSLFKTIDAYPKTLEDFTIKTTTGALVTVISSIIMGALFVIEFRDYLSIQVSEQLYVDTTRIPKMRINFDITFPQIACSFLSVDVVDSSGEQQFGVEHDVFKQRLDLNGKALQEAQQDTINKNHNKTENPETAIATDTVCKSCYGAKEGCCNTCTEVREAYRLKNWSFRPENFEQCVSERNSTLNGLALQEGCHLYGFLEVNRVSGSFHIAPGKSFAVNHLHVHDVQPYTSEDFNTTHFIKYLSLGKPLKEKQNPLDGFSTYSQSGKPVHKLMI